jgi:hypothetical protein
MPLINSFNKKKKIHHRKFVMCQIQYYTRDNKIGTSELRGLEFAVAGFGRGDYKWEC